MTEASQSFAPETQLFRDVFNASPVGIAVENLEGQPLFVNPAFCTFLGFSEEELRSKHCVDFSPPEDAEQDWALFQKLRAGSIDHYQMEKRYFRRDGSLVWGRLSMSLLNARPSPLVVAMVEDITEKRAAMDREHGLLEMMGSITQQMAAAVTRCGRDFRYQWANQAYAAWIQRPVNEVVDHSISDVLGKEAFDSLLPHFQRVLKGETVQHEQETNFRGIGRRWTSATYTPTFDADGATDGWVAVVLDVTDRKRAEEALQQREMELTEAQRLARVGSWQWEPRTDTVIWSKELYCLMGIDPTLPAPSYKEHSHLFAPESWERLQHAVQGALQTGTSYELDLEVVRPGSIAKWEIARGEPVRDKSGQIIGLRGTVQDITERKQAEEALRESEDKLRLLLDSTAEAIYGIDLEHRCTFCNPAFLRTLGYERIDEVLGKNMHDLIHHTRADGTFFPAEECRVHRVLRTGEGDHSEDEVLWRANGTSFPAEYWSYPQRRVQELVGAVVTFIDITQRKLAEEALANVNRRLIEAQERERARIGRELHDDVNQRLAMLAVELEQLEDNPSEVRSRVQELRKQTIEISNDVQALSHELHSSKVEYLGAVGGMKSWCKEFGERQGIQVEFRSAEVQTPVASEIGLCLFRVLQEALHNAAKHSGVRRIGVQLREDSGEIHLVISDLGRGFDLQTAMQGRGLGLMSMQERVRLLNGSIDIQSKSKAGTTIHVRVPLGSEHASQRAAG